MSQKIIKTIWTLTRKLHYLNQVKVQIIKRTDYLGTIKFKSRVLRRATQVKKAAFSRRLMAITMILMKPQVVLQKKRKIIKYRRLLKTMTSTSY